MCFTGGGVIFHSAFNLTSEINSCVAILNYIPKIQSLAFGFRALLLTVNDIIIIISKSETTVQNLTFED